MTATNSVLEIGIHIFDKCATSAGEHLVDVSSEKQTKRRDATDDICEYETDSLSDSTSWKRPPFCKLFIKSVFIVFRIVLLIGCFFAMLGNVLIFIALNTFGLCHWLEDTDERLDEEVFKTRRISQLVRVIILDHYMVFILCTVFTWSAVKQTRIIAVNTLSVFADVFYRVILQVLNTSKPDVLYPLNILYLLAGLHHCYVMGKKVVPQFKSATLKVTVKLCIDLISVLFTFFLMIYAIFPWFITLHGIPKLLVATFAPLLFLPSKLLGRLCVLRLDGVIHPSTGFALVSMIYAADSVVARAMQADLANLKMFVIYGVLHGVIHVLETLALIMFDKTKNPKVNQKTLVFGSSKNTTTRSSPVRRRLTADMTLQTIFYESAAITLTTGCSQLYALVYQPLLSPDQGTAIITQLLTYIFIALFTEFLFHSLSVLLQTRYLNVPVGRVWQRKWRLHLWVSTINTLMCIVYFTYYFLPIVRQKYRSSEDLVFNETCVHPF